MIKWNQKNTQLFKKQAEKEEKSEQRTDMTSRKQRARLCVIQLTILIMMLSVNGLNTHIKCGDCPIR